MMRNKYSRFANQEEIDSGSTSTTRTSDSCIYAMDTLQNNARDIEPSNGLPGSLSSRVSLIEKQKDVAVEASFHNYRNLPDIEINSNGNDLKKISK